MNQEHVLRCIKELGAKQEALAEAQKNLADLRVRFQAAEAREASITKDIAMLWAEMCKAAGVVGMKV